MNELWQLYDEQGVPLDGQGAKKEEAYSRGILHAASHVWIWRKNQDAIEILLQKRSANMPTWPNRYDISAAGHIELGEAPLEAALRETKEEINLDIESSDLKLFNVHRAYIKAESGAIENEFQWLYSLELTKQINFSLQESEVESLAWVPIDQFRVDCMTDQYVPHAQLYYSTVISAIGS